MKSEMQSQSTMQARYERAQALELFQCPNVAVSMALPPVWQEDGVRFFYGRQISQGIEYRLVDVISATNEPAFDHARLAAALSAIKSDVITTYNLPISNLEITHSRMIFTAFGRKWACNADYSLQELQATLSDQYAVSPDGEKAVFVKNNNLWLHDLQTDEEKALTTDGVMYFSYAVQPEGRDLVSGLTDFCQPLSLEVLWSPDSSRLFAVQTDERKVGNMPAMLYVPQDGSLRPRVVERKYALPGDRNIPTYRMLILDVSTGQEVTADHSHVEDSFIWHGPVSGNRAWWSGDSEKAYFLDMARGQKSVRVVEMDAKTGSTRVLFEEKADPYPYLELGHKFESPSVLLPIHGTEELIWFSQRSGFGHLYLYDLRTGKLKNSITSGDYTVSDVIHFDIKQREVTVQLMGRHQERNFYYREIVRVHIDSGEITVIASSDHDYDTYNSMGGAGGISPDGKYIVSTHSRVNTVPVTDVRDWRGNVILTLEEADISGLPDGWQWPEPFVTMAADGETPIYGTLYKPTDFDPEKTYPVFDMAASMPFYAHDLGVKQAFGYSCMPAAAFAELGMIVVTIDGRGTSFRGRRFRDYAYKDFLEQGGLADHVASIKQLAAQRPYMDLTRVGIGESDASNSGIAGLLAYPEFYKVGVAVSPYDPRLIKQGEVYMGLYTEQKRDTAKVWDDAVHNLTGKLLIITGLLDGFFCPSGSFGLTDKLIKANKSFEHQVHPNGGHGWRVRNARRRIWDFLTCHLIGEEPPAGFEVKGSFEENYSHALPEKY